MKVYRGGHRMLGYDKDGNEEWFKGCSLPEGYTETKPSMDEQEPEPKVEVEVEPKANKKGKK